MRRLAAIMIGMMAVATTGIAPGGAAAQYHWRGDDDRRGPPPGGPGGWRGRGDGRDDRGWDDPRRGGDRWAGRRGPPDGYGGRWDGRRGPPPDRYGGRRYRCRDKGNGGTIIGAIAGGLLGNAAAGHGDRTLGTIIGGGAGALAGRAIDRDCR